MVAECFVYISLGRCKVHTGTKVTGTKVDTKKIFQLFIINHAY